MTESVTQRLLALEVETPRTGERATVRAYLTDLLETLWREAEGFSGKRPFGDSGWQADVYAAMVKAGLVAGRVDEDGYLLEVDEPAADELVIAAIRELGKP